VRIEDDNVAEKAVKTMRARPGHRSYSEAAPYRLKAFLRGDVAIDRLGGHTR
jgi:hypothetical protein